MPLDHVTQLVDDISIDSLLLLFCRSMFQISSSRLLGASFVTVELELTLPDCHLKLGQFLKNQLADIRLKVS